MTKPTIYRPGQIVNVMVPDEDGTSSGIGINCRVIRSFKEWGERLYEVRAIDGAEGGVVPADMVGPKA